MPIDETVNMIDATEPAPPPTDPDLVEFASGLVRAAGRFTLEHFRSASLHVETKEDGSPVTIADKGAERLIRDAIHEVFPDDAVHGEEEDPKHGSSGRRWVIDPIDGTKAFTHGVPLYTTLLYLEDEHGPAVGVIGMPALGELVAAGRGLGCTLNGAACRVSDRTELDGAVLTSSGFEYWEPSMMASVRTSGLAMRTWGDGYGYALVASGRAHAMVDPVINFWDIAPCMVIIPEAGGTVSALDGTLPAEPESFVATNGPLHAEVLAVLNR